MAQALVLKEYGTSWLLLLGLIFQVGIAMLLCVLQLVREPQSVLTSTLDSATPLSRVVLPPLSGKSENESDFALLTAFLTILSCLSVSIMRC